MNTPTTALSAGAPADSPAEGVAAPSRALYRFTVVCVVATLLLIGMGAMVTSTGSGMAFPDWPLANGSLWPAHMTLSGLFEHGHRAVATGIGCMVLVLAIWVGVTETRVWLRWLAVAALGVVCLQGVIGGTGVLEGLPAVTSVTHGVLAQVILCLLTGIAFALSPAWRGRDRVDAGQARFAKGAAAVAVALVFVQLILGALLRHTNAAGLLWLHVFNAVAVALAVLVAAMYGSAKFAAFGFGKLTRWILILLSCQVLLGFVTLGVRRIKDPSNVHYLGRSVVVTSHVVVGATLFLLAALLLYRTLRNLEPAASR